MGGRKRNSNRAHEANKEARVTRVRIALAVNPLRGTRRGCVLRCVACEQVVRYLFQDGRCIVCSGSREARAALVAVKKEEAGA